MRAQRMLELEPLGVAPDLPAQAAPPGVWTTGRNMRVVGGGMQRVGGTLEYLQDVGAGLLFPPKYVQMVRAPAGDRFVLYAGAAGVAVCNGIAHYDVTPTAGWSDFLAGSMTGSIYNGIAVFNAPNMAPWYWDGGLVAGSVKPLPGWIPATQARTIGVLNRHIFAGSLATGANAGLGRLAWSDVAPYGSVPSTWIPTTTNQAGELTLGDGQGGILAMAPLSSALMVYRLSGCWAVQYVGRPYIYTARKVTASVGVVSQNAVAQVAGQHALLSIGDLVLTDGVAVRSIGDKRVKRTLFSQVSEDGLRVAHALTLPSRNEVMFCLPIGRDDACNVGYLWNWQDDRWSVVDLPLTTHAVQGYPPTVAVVTRWQDYVGTWAQAWRAWSDPGQGGANERAIMASPGAGRLFMWDQGDLWVDGQPVGAELERRSMPVDPTDRMKWVTRVWPRVDASSGTVLRIQVGGQVDSAEPIAWGPEQLYTVGSSQGVEVQKMARFVSVRVRAQALNRWTLSGLGIEYALAGRA